MRERLRFTQSAIIEHDAGLESSDAGVVTEFPSLIKIAGTWDLHTRPSVVDVNAGDDSSHSVSN